ncbi:AcrR family transcriptional regulator [Marmoricola sp. OAE513]|uniref:TetR/AcrR family transcriptional regulator n=1 Tax=Marmoricola sp. OAE513 TaxID=2817894 RepID=UPI001AE46265
MSSQRHNPDSPKSSEDLALDAARASILDVGWSRTTLTDVARRAGLSRMTLYRRWPQMSALLGDLMTREWVTLVDIDVSTTSHRERLVRGIVGTVRALRANELFTRIVELDPEMLLPYLLERRGRSQELVLDVLAAEITSGQAAGEIRTGEPHVLARALLLAAHGFTLSTQTMVGVDASDDDFAAELAALVERYLAP